jgi:hypothetical protein
MNAQDYPSGSDSYGRDNLGDASEGPTFTGHEVLDEHSQHIGQVTDVFYDQETVDVLPAPTWLVVDPGVLRSSHYVPVAGCYRTEEGAIVVPWDKEWVKSSTKATGDHVLTQEEREQLRSHYALA